MSREINPTQPYQDKLVKLIPTEIIGAYLTLAGILGYAVQPQKTIAPGSDPGSTLNAKLIQIVFFVLLVLTPIYLKKISNVSNVTQLIVTTLSFVVWVYTLGGPFIVWDWYYPLVAPVILVLWSLILPLCISPKEP